MRIRASSLTGYNDCQRRSALNMFPQEIADAGFDVPENYTKQISSAIGTSAHSGVNNIMDTMINTGEYPMFKIMEEIAIETLKFEFKQSEIEFDSVTKNQNASEKQTSRISKAYYYHVAPNIRPELCEKYLEIKRRGHIISGTFDISEFKSIIDFKTGRMKNFRYQIGQYGLLYALNNKDISPPKKYGIISHIPRTPMTKNQEMPVSYSYDMTALYKPVWALINRIIDQYEEFVKTSNPYIFAENLSSIICSPKYCRGFGTGWCELSKQI